ncbi:MAG: amidohydrolase [Clostridia bacterium]
MKIRLYHAKVLTLIGHTPIFDGEVHVDGTEITYAGPAVPDSAAVLFDREIDCCGNLVMPGFKNAHTHSAMTFLRSFADDLPLQDWLFRQVFPKEALLTAEDVHTLTKVAILEYLTSGITALSDMYFFRDTIAQACVETGFRGAIMDGVNNFGGGPEESEAEYHRINGMSQLVSYKISVHGEYTTDLSLLKEMGMLTRKLKEPCFVHMNETEAEVAGCMERHGKRPFEVMDEAGLFDFGGNAYHCVHVSEREMEIMKDRSVYAVTCPASNMKLASGIAPVYEFLQRGIPVAIGTDGAASNNCLDLFREMFLVTGLQKLRHGADAVDAIEVLQMACVNGARALGFLDCDGIAPGKQADLIVIDLCQPNMQPENNIAKNLVYSGSKQNVRMTMVAGKVLYEKGEFHVGVDAERLYAQANTIVDRMKRT